MDSLRASSHRLCAGAASATDASFSTPCKAGVRGGGLSITNYRALRRRSAGPARCARVSRPRTQIDRRSPFPTARCARVSRPRIQIDRRSPCPAARCARVSRPRTQIDRRSLCPAARCARVSRPRTQIDRRSPCPLSLCLCLGVLCVLRGEISLCVGQCDQLPQPAIGHHDVVIEHDKVLVARGPQSLVDRGREHSTCGIGDFGDRHGRGVLRARQVRGRLMGRIIVDDDQLPGCRVCRLRAVLHRHRRVTSSGSQRGMMIDARPASELLGFTAMPHHRSGESGEKIVPSS
jgi:hypothetical protein